MKTRVLIVEPSQVIVAGLVSFLQDNVHIKLLTPEHSDISLAERVAATQPDVLVVNATLAQQAVKACQGRACAVLGLVYQYVDPSIIAHLDGTVDIRDPRQTITSKIIAAASSLTASQAESTTDGDDPDRYELTRRETDVLIEVAKGLTNKEIADKLDVSTYTIISHRKNIVAKTGIKSVAGLTVYALLNNLIDENVLK